MRTAEPTAKLRDAPIGSVVKLPGDERELTVREIRSDGYVELFKGPHKCVTCSAGHEIERVR